jgi:hypothetical protein
MPPEPVPRTAALGGRMELLCLVVGLIIGYGVSKAA